MHAKTPLSLRATPFTPKAGMLPSCQDSKISKYRTHLVAWMPVVFAVDLPLATSQSWDRQDPAAANQEPDSIKLLRGRSCVKERLRRLPSRTPSPSGCSVCFSDASTTADSWLSAESSFTCPSKSDLNQRAANFEGRADIPVKNTFVHFSKADSEDINCSSSAGEEVEKFSRSSSAPGLLHSTAFITTETSTMLELHNLGKCKPCGYLFAKIDGCRWGSNCNFCHFCPEDAIKIRKKMKIKAAKAAKKAALTAEDVDSASS